MDGILLIDKPKGWTSHDVVAKVRGVFKKETSKKIKVGHTGTLDPLATGLLVIVVGSYCKRAGEFSKLDKTYEVTMKLGETSTTGDAEGNVTFVSDKVSTKSELKYAIADFKTTYEQIPPAYSAIKIDGKRAYRLARAGKTVKLEPRKVTIHAIKLIDYKYPEAKFVAEVSSGTYVRSLVNDIGKRLRTGAYITDLRRTKVGKFEITNAYKIADINIDKIANY